MRAGVLLLGIILWLSSCEPPDPARSCSGHPPVPVPRCYWYLHMKALGLTDVSTVIPEAIIDIRYSDTANFMHRDVYGCLNTAFLLPDVANRLAIVQEYLHTLDPPLRLVIFDAGRPRQIQAYMWEITKLPMPEKGMYLSNPVAGSLHNYGAAVDVTLATASGVYLDMGSDYDEFSDRSQPVRQWELLASGVLTKEQIANREILRKAMWKGRFWNIPGEWWHFNAFTLREAQETLTMID